MTAVCLLARVSAAIFLVAAVACSQRAPASPIAVGREVLVSEHDSLSAYSEYTADVDPDHPERLMVCTQPFVPSLNGRKITLHVSFDTGQTWRLAVTDLPIRAGLTVGDPACTYALGNVALLSTLFDHEDEGFGYKPGRYDSWPTGIGQRVYRSTDGGKTWTNPYEMGFMDNQNFLVDRTRGRFHGRIYMNGTLYFGDPFWLIYSADSGRTFARSEPTRVEGHWGQSDRGTILPDGTVLLPYNTSDKGADNSDAQRTKTFAVSISTDGGGHLSQPDTVAPYRPECREGSSPQMAADHSHGPFRGRAYYLWSELEGRAGGGGIAGALAPRCVLVISSSEDGGKTWSNPVQVSDNPYRGASQVGPDAHLSSIAVNKDGVVGVSWYDRREDPKNRVARLRFAASLDGGDTWLPSAPVSTKPFAFEGPRGLPMRAWVFGGGSKLRRGIPVPATGIVRTNIAASRGIRGVGGDYSVLLANPNGTFHAFWVDNRGDVTKPSQLLTTAVTVAGAVQRNGSAEAAPLDDVTRRVEVQYRSSISKWEGDYVDVTLGVVLLNVSPDTIDGPLKYRILGVHSPLGPMVVRDTHADATGTAFDLTGMMPVGGLPPGATTKLYEIKLRAGPVPRALADDGYESIGSFDTKVLGKLRARAH